MKWKFKIIIGLSVVVLPLLLAKAVANSIDYPDADAVALLDKVGVEEIDFDLHEPPYSEHRLLFSRFANSDYVNQFQEISQKHWRSKWRKFRDRLLAAARKNGFDADSLDDCLASTKPNLFQTKAIVPVGAFLGRKGTERIWIVVCVWESNMIIENFWGQHPNAMSHFLAYAFTVKDAKQVGFSTCGSMLF